MKSKFILILLLILSAGCQVKKLKVDCIVYANDVVTIASQKKYNCIAIKDGKIISMGIKGTPWDKKWESKKTISYDGIIYPGFIDAHCHFYGYSRQLGRCDLTGTKSFEEVIDRVKQFAVTHPVGWILGRGWDQNDWNVKEFPDKHILDSLFPNRPVALSRVDGHAMLANSMALYKGIKLVDGAFPPIEGGEILFDHNEPTGILIDNAMELVKRAVPQTTDKEICDALLQAQDSCLSYGLTMMADAGLDYKIINLIDSMHNNGKLKVRIYAMLDCYDPENIKIMQNGPHQTERLKVMSVKIYADGALGSRGAMLKKPYCDRHDHSGALINNPKWLDSVIGMYSKYGFQVNTHCIGDSANRLILESYSKYLVPGNDKRWRVEHAQIMDTNDFVFFRKYNIIPSVQPTHAISDLPWATDRICENRLVGAYAYKQLLNQNGWMPLGTDFPVEGLSPLKTIQAATASNIPEEKKKSLEFYKNHAIGLNDAINGITTWAAKACFWENEIGSLKIGMWADFVVLDSKITTENLSPSINMVYIKGEKVFEKK